MVAAAPYARALPPPGTAASQDWPALSFEAVRTPTWLPEQEAYPSSAQSDSLMPQLTPSAVKEQVMLPDGDEKESTVIAPAGAGYLTGSSVVALGEGVACAGDEEEAEGVASELVAGPSYPRVKT